jgi:glycosyltransferase involved in cell wall biosynthesis
MTQGMVRPALSIVVPAYNEAENLPVLHEELTAALKRLGKSYEIIIIDDGSTDGSYESLLKLQQRDAHLVIIRFRRNFGQTAAMDSGFKQAQGDVIVTMDADLQNDPADIAALLESMESEKLDVVSGWRWQRRDPIGKRLVSKFANGLRKMLTGERIHDSGCTLKAFRKECFDGLDLQGEMHRFIPAILMWRGFKVGEVKTNHRERKFGRTKYGVNRLLRGFLDLLVVKFWMQYSTSPIRLFGGVGLLMFFLGGMVGAYLTILKLVYQVGLSDRPLLLLAALLMIVGVQLVMFGFLADILVKLFFRGHPNYLIEAVKRK